MKIGITQRILQHNKNSYDAIDQHWYRFLKDHEVVPIPNRLDQNFKELAVLLDRLVVSGGDETDLRVAVEKELIKEMLRQCKPILGVCHGAFLLNELLGGQNIICENHHNTFHHVVLDDDEHIVNSHHKLQMKKTPLYVTELATDLEGYCESWIYKDMCAIVWHPERMENPVIPKKIIDVFFT